MKTRPKILLVILALIVFGYLLLFIYSFSIAFDNHYDVKKNSLMWIIGIDNRIKKFPQIEPIKTAKYNHIGGDSPSIAGGSEIEYETSKSIENVIPIVNGYLDRLGFKIKDSLIVRKEGMVKEVIYLGESGSDRVKVELIKNISDVLEIKVAIVK